MNTTNNLRILTEDELLTVCGGTSFFYKLGKFFAEQANASDAIHKRYGNTNRNHIW